MVLSSCYSFNKNESLYDTDFIFNDIINGHLSLPSLPEVFLKVFLCPNVILFHQLVLGIT